MDFRRVKLAKRMNLKQLKGSQLESLYKLLCEKLDEEYGVEATVTRHEALFTNTLSKYTRLKFYRSTWIGRRCVDIFLPSIAGPISATPRKMKGLVIELNGTVHDKYEKMNKDENLGEYLSQLGIAVHTIENCDIKHPNTISLLEQLSSLERIDTRARQRLWRAIYIETIRKNEDLIKSIGRADSKRTLEILRRVQ